MDDDRRSFLKQTLKFGGTLVAVGSGSSLIIMAKGKKPVKAGVKIKDFRHSGQKLPKDLAVIKGKDHAAITRRAVKELGGMSAFVKKGESVLIKPNAAWNRPVELGANTNPIVLGAIIDMVKEAGAKRIIVADNTCNEAKKSFKTNGIEKACKDHGAEIVWVTEESSFVSLSGTSTFLDSWKFLKLFQEVDRVINVPVVKNHSLSQATISMKNWFGAITGKRSLLHQNIHQTVAFFGKIVNPTLVIADATRVMMDNGPAGGSLEDVKIFDTVIAGVDQVLVDTHGCGLLGLDKKLPEFIDIAARIGVGSKDLAKANKAIIEL